MLAKLSWKDQSMSDLLLGTSVVAGSACPPMPASIIHLVSIGFESLVLETWLDLRSGNCRVQIFNIYFLNLMVTCCRFYICLLFQIN